MTKQLKIRILPRGTTPGDHVVDEWRYCPIIEYGQRLGYDVKFYKRNEDCDIILASIQQKYETFFTQGETTIIGDLTDDPLCYPWHRLNIAGKGYVLLRRCFQGYRRRIKSMLRHSDALLVGSRCQKENLQKYNKRIKVLVDSIPSFPETRPSGCRSISGEKVNIGWFGNLESLDGLLSIKAALNRLDPRRYKLTVVTSRGVKGRYIGKAPRTAMELCNQVMMECEVREWKKNSYQMCLSDIDIGIVPVITKSCFTASKPPGRALLLMALGIPVIASNTRAHQEVVRNGRNGFIAESLDEWARYISSLADNPELRDSMAGLGRRYVSINFNSTRFGRHAIAFIEKVHRER